MYRATVDGREIKVHIGADSSIWTWNMVRGQVTLANSDDSYQWALAHVHPDDLPAVRSKLKPNQANHYMSSHLVG